MTGTHDDDHPSIDDAASNDAMTENDDKDWTAPHVSLRRQPTGLPLVGLWAEIPRKRGPGSRVRCMLACAHLPGAQDYLSRYGADLVAKRAAISWSVREFRTHPVRRPFCGPGGPPRLRIAVQNILEIGG